MDWTTHRAGGPYRYSNSDQWGVHVAAVPPVTFAAAASGAAAVEAVRFACGTAARVAGLRLFGGGQLLVRKLDPAMVDVREKRQGRRAGVCWRCGL